MAEGTKDVTKDLQERTDPIASDSLLLVNGVTKQVQEIKMEKLKDNVQIIRKRVFSNNISDI